ncbi:MAG TPA: hypothetical protein VK961_03810 [Chthoniobacter sp.]|nr:hypothetical protein [Chthoniobacter sp.]
MNVKALAVSLLSAVVLVPTGAFAKDKHRDNYYDHQAQIEADRRANGYYNPVPCAPRVYDNCRPDYRARYYTPSDCDRRDYRPSGFWVRIR